MKDNFKLKITIEVIASILALVAVIGIILALTNHVPTGGGQVITSEIISSSSEIIADGDLVIKSSSNGIVF